MLRREYEARLRIPYGDILEGEQGDPTRALNIHSPNLNTLENEILADLAPAPPYGVRRFAPYPGTSRRILISDQLVACVQSVSTNLLEAGGLARGTTRSTELQVLSALKSPAQIA